MVCMSTPLGGVTDLWIGQAPTCEALVNSPFFGCRFAISNYGKVGVKEGRGVRINGTLLAAKVLRSNFLWRHRKLELPQKTDVGRWVSVGRISSW